MSSELIPVPLTIHENGYWKNEDDTILVYDGFSNIPPILKSRIDKIDIAKHAVKTKQLIKAPTNNGIIHLYRLTNNSNNRAIYRAEIIDAVLQYSNPDLYLTEDEFLLVEHDEGYVLICSVRVSGDLFWLIEGNEIEVKKRNTYETKT